MVRGPLLPWTLGRRYHRVSDGGRKAFFIGGLNTCIPWSRPKAACWSASLRECPWVALGSPAGGGTKFSFKMCSKDKHVENVGYTQENLFHGFGRYLGIIFLEIWGYTAGGGG